ncbi:pseudouridine synthase [Saccharata proteae CBS 121410]|uniref:tRNA pseudouridine(55) synthase n=1 Tax=Saccharata proteae CBS 121410 TaxID=1314787 RepID=A0A9P4LXB7_9PEZI|nr:pseudouridine synthase [Saccharata proteae CBS 121410]
MSSASSPVLEGIFAIHKPPVISSAQVLRDVEDQFNPSKLFAPLLAAERERLQSEWDNQSRKNTKWKKSRGAPDRTRRVKLGHGGTLDPLATGVLITGVGKGTKHLGRFLDCTKEYECTLLFGCATDGYDSTGKVVARAPYSHLTRETVEAALDKFRGPIMQRPSIFSAIRVKGKKMYEYAREGKDIPELPERPVEVINLEMLEWIEPGTHEWRYPKEEVTAEEKDFANKAMPGAQNEKAEPEGLKRKRIEEELDNDIVTKDDAAAKKAKTDAEAEMSGALPAAGDAAPSKAQAEDATSSKTEAEDPTADANTASEAATTTEEAAPSIVPAQKEDGANAPAVRLRMTVSSGFYVRSLCHDLGVAVGSMGIMTSLLRTRQGDFALGQNVLEYDDLAKGEEVWGPKVKGMLEEWMAKEE